MEAITYVIYGLVAVLLAVVARRLNDDSLCL